MGEGFNPSTKGLQIKIYRVLGLFFRRPVEHALAMALSGHFYVDEGAWAFNLLTIRWIFWFYPAAWAICFPIFLFPLDQTFYGLKQVQLPQEIPVLCGKCPNGCDERFLFRHYDPTIFFAYKILPPNLGRPVSGDLDFLPPPHS